MSGWECDEAIASIHQNGRATIYLAMPDALALDCGIEVKKSCRRWRGRISQIDAVTVRVTTKAELQTCRFAGGRPFYTIVTSPDTLRYRLGTSPKGRRKSPSRAREDTTEFNAASPNNRRARYKLDFPLPFAPVTTFNLSSGSTRSRRERYPEMATVVIT